MDKPPSGPSVLATVLAAVAAGGGAEISGTCSRLVSVKSSFEGVMFAAGSKGRSGSGGVLGISTLSMTGGGGSPGISVSIGIDGAGTDDCTGSSWLGAA